MICPTCDQVERQDRKTVVANLRPLTLHRECLAGHAWHMPWSFDRGLGLYPAIARRTPDGPRHHSPWPTPLPRPRIPGTRSVPRAAMPELHAYLDSWRGIGLIERALIAVGWLLAMSTTAHAR